MTSTFFEGTAARNPLAQRGYSRDQRPDCQQVCIALAVSRCGMPLGYEVFAGNTADVTTVQTIVTTMEARYGKSNRVWAHILVCFLAFVLWKTLAALCQRAGLGDEPRRVLSELSDLRAVDVILPTDDGHEIRKRCLTRPSEHQTILCTNSAWNSRPESLRSKCSDDFGVTHLENSALTSTDREVGLA
jgi:hypothetical protein